MATRIVDWFGLQAYFADLVHKTAEKHGIPPLHIIDTQRKPAAVVAARHEVVDRLRSVVGMHHRHEHDKAAIQARGGNWYKRRTTIAVVEWRIKDDPSETWCSSCTYRISYPRIAALFGSPDHTTFLKARRKSEAEASVRPDSPRCIRSNCLNAARGAGPVCGECLSDEASIRSPKADVVHQVA